MKYLVNLLGLLAYIILGIGLIFLACTGVFSVSEWLTTQSVGEILGLAFVFIGAVGGISYFIGFASSALLTRVTPHKKVGSWIVIIAGSLFASYYIFSQRRMFWEFDMLNGKGILVCLFLSVIAVQFTWVLSAF